MDQKSGKISTQDRIVNALPFISMLILLAAGVVLAL